MYRVLLFLLAFSITSHAKAQILEWVKLIGANSSGQTTAQVNDLAVDSLANAYYIGKFTANSPYQLDLDPGPGVVNYSINGGNSDHFFLALDGNAQYKYSYTLGTAADPDEGFHVKVAPDGNIITAGWFVDTVDFDPGPGVTELVAGPVFPSITTRPDIFIKKSDNQGNLLWVGSFSGASREWIQDIDVDSWGNIYLTGWHYDTLDLDPGPNVNQYSTLGDGIFVVKLDPNGSFLWAHSIGETQYNEPYSIEADDLGNVFCYGYFNGTIDFDPGPGVQNLTGNINAGNRYLLKLDSAGNFGWVKQFGGGAIFDSDMKLDSNSNVYIGGNYLGSGDFDPGPGQAVLTYFNQGKSNVFALKLDINGDFVWVADIRGMDQQLYGDMEVSRSGEVYLSARSSDTVDIDPGVGIQQLPGGTAYFIKLNQNGELVYGDQFNGANYIETKAISISDSGKIYLSGYFSGTCDFALGPDSNFVTSPFSRPFLAKYSEDTCASLTLVVDSLSNGACTGPGFTSIDLSGGAPPYSILWNNTPASTDTFAIITQAGLYEVMVSDSIGCQQSRSVFVDHPPFPGNFDLFPLQHNNTFRPGQETSIWVEAVNDGCTIISGTVTAIVEGPVAYTNSTISPQSISGDTLTWLFPLMSYDSIHWKSLLTYTTDSLANLGDTVCITVIIEPITGDIDPGNNVRTYCTTVINSYDPNDKQVYPQGVCEENYTLLDGNPLTYTVRFQNTGNAPALRVYILDTIAPSLDFESMRVLSTSHDMVPEALPGNILRFLFEDINLAAQSVDEPNSHGYVTFEIWPETNVLPETEIENSAAIYFDFNAPIITNTVLNTMVDTLPSCLVLSTLHEQEVINVFPNPNEGSFYLEWLGGQQQLQVRVYNLEGKLVYQREFNENGRYPIQLGETKGLFLLSTQTEDGIRDFRKILVR